MENLTGKKIDNLEIIRLIGKTPYGDYVYECSCKCGRTVTRNQRALLNNAHFHSCGCYSRQYLTPGDSKRCSIAGKQRAKVRNRNGINMDMLDNSKNISTNTSGHKGISWSKAAHKWHVFIGYKNYRCNLAFVEDFNDAVKLREKAYEAIENDTFEDFFYQLRGFRLEDRLQKIKKEKK